MMDGNRCRDLQQNTGLSCGNPAEERDGLDEPGGQGYHKEIHRNDLHGLIGGHRLWTDRETAWI